MTFHVITSSYKHFIIMRTHHRPYGPCLYLSPVMQMTAQSAAQSTLQRKLRRRLRHKMPSLRRSLWRNSRRRLRHSLWQGGRIRATPATLQLGLILKKSDLQIGEQENGKEKGKKEKRKKNPRGRKDRAFQSLIELVVFSLMQSQLSLQILQHLIIFVSQSGHDSL